VYLLWRAAKPYVTDKPKPRVGEKKKRAALPPEDRIDGKLPHEILGVARDAPFSDVQASYRRLAHETHPDKTAQLSAAERAEADARMKRINQAYAALSKRKPG
jgi:DnaJ-class molecular chaperone